MKKTSKMFGAVALSAALAFGCALPAFAVPTEESSASFTTKTVTDDPTEITKDNTGDAKTDINLRTETDQINCTIPVKMTVVAKVAGGDILCPTTAYKIVNMNQDSALYVNHVKAELDSNWEAVAEAVKPSGDIPHAGTYGAVWMGLSTPTGDAGAAVDEVLIGAKSGANSATAGALDKDVTWKIAKADDAAGKDLLITLTGKSSKVEGIDTDKTAGEKLVTVTYTVSAMPATADTTLATD